MEKENPILAWYGNLSQREQRLVIVWIVAMAFIGLFIVGVQINGAIQDRRDGIERYEKALKLITQKQDEYVQAKNSGGGGGKSLKERIETNDLKLKTFLDKEATRFDLKINNFKESTGLVGGKRGKAEAGDTIEESVTIEIDQADYDQFARFLDKLHSAPELLVIRRVDVQKPRRSASPQQVRVQMIISTFKKKGEA